MKYAIGLAAVALATTLLEAQTPARTPHPKRQQVTFEQTGYFYGDEQYYVVAPPMIHVYDAVWPDRPEKYRHEVFRIDHGKWAKTITSPTGKPRLFLTEDLCDTDNHLDVPSGPLRNALPRGVRIKDVESHLDYAVAIYSDTPAQTEWYSLKTSLLSRDGTIDWRVVKTIYAGDFRHYCGREEFPVFTRSREQSFVLLLYTSETDAEDRGFIDIQSFLVKKRALE